MSGDAVARVAAVLRDLFYNELRYRQGDKAAEQRVKYLDGGRSARHGVQLPRAWDTAAETVIRHQIDPAIFVMTVFCNRTSYPTTSHEINNPGVLRRCLSYIEQLPETLAATYHSDLTRLNAFLQELSAMPYAEEVKTGMALNKYAATCSSRLLHYCFAVAAGRPDMAATSREKAIAELAIYPEAYRNAWPSGLIPDELVRAATERRRRLDAFLKD